MVLRLDAGFFKNLRPIAEFFYSDPQEIPAKSI